MLLGVTPDKAEEGYGWIEPRGMVASWVSRRVKRFWEKPSSMQARTLLKRGALWNTFVFFTRAATLWQMVRQAAPDLYEAFVKIRRALGNLQAEQVTENVYAISQLLLGNMRAIVGAVAGISSARGWME